MTVSLDTLDPARFRDLTRFDELPRVLAGIDAAVAAGFPDLKIDSVVIRGVNDDELVPLLERGRAWGAEVRFIEYMDVGGATQWSPERVVSRTEMLGRIAAHYGEVAPVLEQGSAPAERFRLPDGTTFGIIASTTAPFCRACDRSRLTADGQWYLCLYAKRGIDLRAPLRAGASADELRDDPRLRLAQPRRPRRRGAPRGRRTFASPAPIRARPRPAPRDAHSGRLKRS